ncbi:hypothetical protein FNV43_RR09886 [Rhamnella rubrinervis]|uniref:Uncharacterized protein n=1 Tax=Rhamnella rubrinervis TaxID=2594499 RepID=A0A8K0HC59_9ROSA|nr:hypothetical protein FNV43_RR09886 [Rhamnella rubrinervis]
MAANLSRAGTTLARSAKLRHTSFGHRPILERFTPRKWLHDGIGGLNANPVAVQMVDYALSHARSQKSVESYAQSMLVLEQCLSNQPTEEQAPDSDNSRGIVLMAMSTLFYERGNLNEAIEKLQRIQSLTCCSLNVRVAAMEALVGLHLELGQDDTSSVLADKCLELFGENEPGFSDGVAEVIHPRAKAVKGLVELVHGHFHSAQPFFEGPEENKGFISSVALSYGEYLHATQNFSLAKELYQNVIQSLSEKKDSSDPYALAACNMSSEEVLMAATCALGQLEAQFGNFGDAEEILTKALTRTEERFGSHHPKVGVVLTCIALMFRQKAMKERSSSLLIQEGLYRRAIELLKAPLVDTEGVEATVDKGDMVALARGGYAEALCVQQSRKDQGEKMKIWAERAWKNRRLSLADALEISESSSKTIVIDARISRVL